MKIILDTGIGLVVVVVYVYIIDPGYILKYA